MCTLTHNLCSICNKHTRTFTGRLTLFLSACSSDSSSFASMHVCVYEGASEEKGSCGIKLKAFDTVQLCRTPTKGRTSAPQPENEIIKVKVAGERRQSSGHKTARRNWQKVRSDIIFVMCCYLIKKGKFLMNVSVFYRLACL